MWESRSSPPPEPSSTTQEVPNNYVSSSNVALALDLSTNSRRPPKRHFPLPEETHVVPQSSNVSVKDEDLSKSKTSKKLKMEQGEEGIGVGIRTTPLKKKKASKVRIVSICADAYQEGHSEPIPIKTYGFQVIVTKTDQTGELMKSMKVLKTRANNKFQIEDDQVKLGRIKKPSTHHQTKLSKEVSSQPVVIIATEARPRRKRPQPNILITKGEEPPVKKSKASEAEDPQKITAEPAQVMASPPTTQTISGGRSPVIPAPKQMAPKVLMAMSKDPKLQKTVISTNSVASISTSKKRKVLKKRRKKSEMKDGGSPKILFSGDVALRSGDSEREISTSSEDEDGSKKTFVVKSAKDAASVDEHFQKSLGPQVYEQLFCRKNPGQGLGPFFQQATSAIQNQCQMSGSWGISNPFGLRCSCICGFGHGHNMTMTSFSHRQQQRPATFQLGPFPSV